ncbi:MAG: AAC(3) family N-acetyltransferase [Clostridia bacterium]|nr:AAC(3) family N-acetyltransferase [Clostridia bacterium]
MINERMKKDLIALGIKPQDTILMHSSLSSLGYVEGGAETVIDTLLSVLREGTLLVPALSWTTVNKDNPVFDVKNTPSCIGAISEYFRKREGVIRSLHPTHSVCGIGKNAKEILSHHLETNTPVGIRSPFSLLRDYNGKVLMLGCTLRPNTSMHGVEETVDPEPWYVLTKDTTEFTLIDENGKKYVQSYRCHNFGVTKMAQRYERLATVMDIPHGKVLEAECWLVPSKEMWEIGKQKIMEKEEFFVDPYKD